MILHILRWHGGDREPVYLGDHSEYLLKSKNFNDQRLSHKTLDPITEFINKVHRQVREGKNNIAKVHEIMSFFGANKTPIPVICTNPDLFNSPSSNYGGLAVPPFIQHPSFDGSNKTIVNSSTPQNTSSVTLKENGIEKIAGFTANVCDICAGVVIETQYSVEVGREEPKLVKRNNHTCTRMVSAPKFASLLQFMKISTMFMHMPLELAQAVAEWTWPDSFLIAMRVPIFLVDRKEIIDVLMTPQANSDKDGNEMWTNGWALEAAKKGWIILNNEELVDFIKIAKHKTSVYFRIRIDKPSGGGKECFGSDTIYLMFIDKYPPRFMMPLQLLQEYARSNINISYVNLLRHIYVLLWINIITNHNMQSTYNLSL
jgi:hypothetical protein